MGLIMGLMMINNGIDIDIVMGGTMITGIDNGIQWLMGFIMINNIDTMGLIVVDEYWLWMIHGDTY